MAYSFNALLANSETLTKKGLHADALSELNQALKLKPGDLNLLLRRSRSLIHTGDTDAAINDAKTVLKTKNLSTVIKANAFLTLGDALYASGDLERACVTYHRGYRVRPLASLSEGITRAELSILNTVSASSKVNVSEIPSPSIPHDLRSCRAIADSMSCMNIFEDRAQTPVFSSPSRTIPRLNLSSSSAFLTPKRSPRNSSTPNSTASLSADRKYLSELLKDTSFKSSPRTPRERRKERQHSTLKTEEHDEFEEQVEVNTKPTTVKEIIDNGLHYINKREGFWLERSSEVKQEAPRTTPHSRRSLSGYSPRSARPYKPNQSNLTPITLQTPPSTRKSKLTPRFSPRFSSNVDLDEQPGVSTHHSQQRFLFESLQNAVSALENGAPKLALKIGNDLLAKLSSSSDIIKDQKQLDLIESRVRDVIGLSYLILERPRDAIVHFEKAVKFISHHLTSTDTRVLSVVKDCVKYHRHYSNALGLVSKYYKSATVLKESFKFLKILNELENLDQETSNIRQLKFLVEECRLWMSALTQFSENQKEITIDENFKNVALENALSAANQGFEIIGVSLPKHGQDFKLPETLSFHPWLFKFLIFLTRIYLAKEQFDDSYAVFNLIFSKFLSIDLECIEDINDAEFFKNLKEHSKIIDPTLIPEMVAVLGSVALSSGKFNLSRYMHNISLKFEEV
ncbi:hypothetical protein GEMRC1_007013 [Eukaryota sp. GEM-RC1]